MYFDMNSESVISNSTFDHPTIMANFLRIKVYNKHCGIQLRRDLL